MNDAAYKGTIAHRLDLVSEAMAAHSRTDPNDFLHFIFGHKQHAWHRELQRLLTKFPRLCVDAPVEHGKTTQVVARICWEIGRNPDAMIGYFSNSTVLPERVIRTVRGVLESEKFAQVFPGIKVRKATTSEVWVERHGGGMHPTLLGLGIGGSIIGSRLTHLVLDDIQDFQNTWTDHERKKLWELLQSTVLNRLLQNGVLWDIGTPWHVLDARHQLRRLFGYHYARFDATIGETYELDGQRVPLKNGDAEGLWSATYTNPINGQMFGFPTARLVEKRRQMPHLEYDRQFRCIASAGSLRIFDPEALDRAVKAGRGFAMPGRAHENDPVLSGVDLAVARDSYADETVIHTGTVREYAGGPRFLPLDIRHGHWEVTRIFEEMRTVLGLYPNHLGFTIEDNAAQDYLIQMLNNPKHLRGLGWSDTEIARLRVRPFTTTAKNKWSNTIGVRAMAADFEQDRWILPSDEYGNALPEVQLLVDGLLGFDPSSHTSDHVMAAWLFLEQARRYGVGSADDLWAQVGLG